MVEFTLSWILFLVVTVIGVMDLGRAVWAYNLVAHSARAGARFAMVHGSKSVTPAAVADIEAVVRAQAPILDQSKLAVNTSWDPTNDPGGVVQVRVLYDFRPVLGVFLPANISIGSKSRKVITH